MKLPSNRKGFVIKEPVIVDQVTEEKELKHVGNLVYFNAKLNHNGIVGYKVFENCFRKLHRNSLANLLNNISLDDSSVYYLVKEFKACKSDEQRSKVNDSAVEQLDQEKFDKFLVHTKQAKSLNPAQSRKVNNLAKKLAYYTQKRQFTSKRSGKYQMKVAFITLTAPENANQKQIYAAFNHFLDYLQRTANCVYVWKKELGEKSGHLHFHVLINNFIPYYIISWKWKRVLLSQGVKFNQDVNGADSNSHSRIELPRNRRQTAAYIAKYLSKVYTISGELGNISGHSKALDDLKELTIIEGNWPSEEIEYLKKNFKVVSRDYVSIICCDLLKIKKQCPKIGALFEKQYIEFSERITLPQKFHEI